MSTQSMPIPTPLNLLTQDASFWPRVIDQTSDALVLVTPDGKIAHVNQAFERVTGYSRTEAVGQASNLLKSGHQSKEFYAQLWHTLRSTGRWEGEIYNRRKDGNIYLEHLSISTVRDDRGELVCYVGLFHDLAFSAEQAAHYVKLAHTDALTGLPNRLAMDVYIPQAILRAHTTYTTMAVGILDLDDFKTVNDMLGHLAGDELLRELAARLRRRMRATDLVARMGGDEFVLVFESVNHQAMLDGLIARVHSAIDDPFDLHGTKINLGISMGLALHSGQPNHESDLPSDPQAATTTLLTRADTALRSCKAARHTRSTWHAYWAEQTPNQDNPAPARPAAYGPDAARLMRTTRSKLRACIPSALQRMRAVLGDMNQALSHEVLAQAADIASITCQIEDQRARAASIAHLAVEHGVALDVIARAWSEYGSLLTDAILSSQARASERLGLLAIIAERIQNEMLFEIQAARPSVRASMV